MASSTAVAEPDWLAARRSDALGALRGLQMPSFRGTPGWEFTPIAKLELDAFEMAPGGDPEAAQDVLALPEGVHRASADPAEPPGAGEGPLVLGLALAAERYPELVRAHLGSTVPAGSPFVARNEAHWTDGWLVHVPRDTACLSRSCSAPFTTGPTARCTTVC